MKTYAIVLAAGKGTRMNSSKTKVMHEISGIPMLDHIVRKLENIHVDQIYVITGHGSDQILNYYKDSSNKITFIKQEEQLGTAHAVLQVSKELAGLPGKTLVLTGDTPLISEETLLTLIQKSGLADGTVLTTLEENPFGYGRILRSENNDILGIVEEKDATPEQKLINEVNTGIFCFNNESLFNHLGDIKNDNNQREYYLTDIVDVFIKSDKKFDSYITKNNIEVMGINDRIQLSIAQKQHQILIKKRHMLNGVTFLNQDSCYIEEDVVIGRDVVIESNVSLKGYTSLNNNVFVGAGTEIINSSIDSFSKIVNSYINESEIGKNVSIGPFANIRPETNIFDNVKIGNFVELKKTTVRNNSKISHLSYIGDSDIGENVNIGCGSITVNYDGENKYKTIIKDNAFVGCNVNLIAPVTIGEDAVVAAGSTITNNVPPKALAIARERQYNKENYRK